MAWELCSSEDIKHLNSLVIQYWTGGFSLLVLGLSVTLKGPPLDSEKVLAGEL